MNDLKTAVRQAKEGNEQGFQDLYEATRKTALAVIRRYCDETRDYEDILQETYIKVYQSIGSLQDDEKAQAWVNRIAANTAIRHNMKKKPKLFTEMADEEGQLPEFEDDNVSVNPELIADRKAVSEIVLEVMKDIPEDQRDALWMVYGQHVTIREMAESLGVSENTIKSRLFQGKKKLMQKKEMFKKLGIDLRLVPVAALIGLAFEDTTYAAAGAVLSGAAASGAALAGAQIAAAETGAASSARAAASGASSATGSGASAGASASSAGTAASTAAATETAASAAGAGTAAGAATAGSASAAAGTAAAAGSGSAAAAGAAIAGMSAAAKLGIAAAAAVVIGGGAAAVHAAGGNAYLAPVEYKIACYNDREMGMEETYRCFYPEKAVDKIDDFLDDADSTIAQYYAQMWNDSQYENLYYNEDAGRFDASYGDDWKLSVKKESVEKLSGDELEAIQKDYENDPMSIYPVSDLYKMYAEDNDEREALETYLKDLAVTEAYQLELRLTAKGSEGTSSDEISVCTVKYGGDWVIYPKKSDDITYAIYFGMNAGAAGTEAAAETTAQQDEQAAETETADSYDNDINRSAVAAYREAIENRSWLPDGIEPDANSMFSFSLADLNDDKIYEVFVSYEGEFYVDTFSALLYYQDGQVRVLSLEGQKGAVGIYPGQARLTAYHVDYNVEIAGKVYDFSDGSPKEAEEFSYSISSSEGERTEAARARITELLQAASPVTFMEATDANIEAYLSGSGKATPLEEASGDLAESLSGVFESIDFAAGEQGDAQPADDFAAKYPAITRVDASGQLDRDQLESNVISVIRKMYQQTNADAVQRNETNWYVPVGSEDSYQLVKIVDDNSGFDELMQENGYAEYRVETYFDNPQVMSPDGGSAAVNPAGPNFIYAVIDGKEYRYYFADDIFVRYIGPDGAVQDYPEMSDFAYELYASGADRYQSEDISYDSRRFYSDLTDIQDNGSSLMFTASAFDSSGTLSEEELNRTYHLTIDAATKLNTEADSIRRDKLYQDGDSAYSFMKRYLLEGEPTVTGYIPSIDCFELQLTGDHVDAVDGIWATH